MVPTAQTLIPNSAVSSQITPSRAERRALYIRNYAASVGTMWLAFGATATAGINGEMEIPPGGEYNWNGLLGPLQGTVPLESINIIISGGTATGCVVEFL